MREEQEEKRRQELIVRACLSPLWPIRATADQTFCVPVLCFALADKCCVGQERAHLAEGQRQAAVQKIQGETKMLLESCSRNNVSVLTILQASASEFQTVTKELLESMDDTNTDVVEEMLETIEACVAEVQAQREQLVTGAHELAESLHGVVVRSRHDIAGIWVALFSRCQRYRC